MSVESPTKYVRLEKRPGASEGVDQVVTLGKIIQDRGNSKCKALKLEADQILCGRRKRQG